MSDKLEQKIRKMHAAFSDVSQSDLSSVQVEVGRGYCHVDFSGGSDETDLQNAASLLVHNIASLKDHLKVWCQKNGAKFGGDVLIDSNRSVAIVHDLWNVDKHGELDKKPRSGIIPELRNHMTLLHFGTSDGPMSFQLDPSTGQMNNHGGKLTIFADVYNESGTKIGRLDKL